MKSIFMMRKKKDAVSPVIATILMVAITVVLAAVLYVMVMGFGTDGGTKTPTGAFTASTAPTANSTKLQFGVFTPDVKITDCKLLITDNSNNAQVVFTFASANTGRGAIPVGGVVLTGMDAAANFPCAYVDLAGNSVISSGDYVNIFWVAAGSGSSSYTAQILFVSTGDVINSITFSR